MKQMDINEAREAIRDMIRENSLDERTAYMTLTKRHFDESELTFIICNKLLGTNGLFSTLRLVYPKLSFGEFKKHHKILQSVGIQN